MKDNTLYLLGYASGAAGADEHSGDGPLILQNSPYFLDLIKKGLALQWKAMLRAVNNKMQQDPLIVQSICEKLAKEVSSLVKNQKRVCVLGGDHTSAIGTFSGVYDALYNKGEIGLIWIDAHMDSHTPETTESGHIHGMPLASLMGYGFASLTSILHKHPKIKPENVCLIGVRSFEKGEAAFLKKMQVRIFDMQEVKTKGFLAVLQEAVKLVNLHTIGYGISLDLDAIDPKDAPGVDVPEPDGISANDVIEGLTQIISDPRLLATEIVEFDPTRDKNHLTERLITTILEIIASKQLC